VTLVKKIISSYCYPNVSLCHANRYFAVVIGSWSLWGIPSATFNRWVIERFRGVIIGGVRLPIAVK
jgi:hypothetical protein